MRKKVKIANFQDLVDILNSEEYRNARASDYDFATYRHDDNLEIQYGHNKVFNEMELQIRRSSSLQAAMLQTDTDALAALPVDELRREFDLHKSLICEEHKALCKQADNLQARVLYLRILQHIIKVHELPRATHTYNQWVCVNAADNQYERSNAVYHMSYGFSYDTEWVGQHWQRTGKCWLRWSFYLQSVAEEARSGRKYIHIASQDRNFKNEEEMQKYLGGRIKAYDKYFKEEFPPVPTQYLRYFTYAGQLLPGYREEVQA